MPINQTIELEFYKKERVKASGNKELLKKNISENKEKSGEIDDIKEDPIENDMETKTKKELKAMKVVELRSLARELDGINMERNHIKYARKKELIETILEFYEGGK